MAGELAGIVEWVAGGVAPPAGQRFGLVEAAKPVWAAALAQSRNRPVLIVAPSPARAAALHDELVMLLTPGQLGRILERERLPYELVLDDPATGLERSRAHRLLAGEGAAVVVASWAALAEHAAPPSGAQDLALSAGARHDLPQVLAQLEAAGYELSAYADRPGTGARRGGIVDVFPAGQEHPVRVEFFGNEIESIRLLDASSQRSTGRVPGVTVPALATSRTQAQSAARDDRQASPRPACRVPFL